MSSEFGAPLYRPDLEYVAPPPSSLGTDPWMIQTYLPHVLTCPRQLGLIQFKQSLIKNVNNEKYATPEPRMTADRVRACVFMSSSHVLALTDLQTSRRIASKRRQSRESRRLRGQLCMGPCARSLPLLISISDAGSVSRSLSRKLAAPCRPDVHLMPRFKDMTTLSERSES